MFKTKRVDKIKQKIKSEKGYQKIKMNSRK